MNLHPTQAKLKLLLVKSKLLLVKSAADMQQTVHHFFLELKANKFRPKLAVLNIWPNRALYFVLCR